MIITRVITLDFQITDLHRPERVSCWRRKRLRRQSLSSSVAGFLQLLSQLTTVGDMSFSHFEGMLASLSGAASEAEPKQTVGVRDQRRDSAIVCSPAGIHSKLSC